MSSWLFSTNFTYGALVIAVALLIWSRRSRSNLDSLPAIGPTGFLTYYLGVVSFIKDANRMVQEGYEKYPNGMFRVPSLHHWIVVVSGQELIDDIRTAKEEFLSFTDSANEVVQVEYTLGRSIAENTYHVGTVRTTLNRNFVGLFPGVRDEIAVAFEELIPAQNDWVKVPAFNTVLQIASRATHRLFVGLPLCRNRDYIDLNLDVAIEVAKAGIIINLFPEFLKPLVGKLVSNVPSYIRRVIGHLGPIVKERLKREEEEGKDWPGKPNDLISWLIDDAQGEERSVDSLCMRVLTVNFTAMHTSSMAFTHILYDLAAQPEYCQPLREEVEAVIQQDGWTKDALDKMHKIDSFVRESQRMHGILAFTLIRKARKAFTFSNGVTLPAGTHIAVATFSTHHDEEKYPDPYVFKPFRFSDMRQGDDQSFKGQAVSTSAEYMAFGHGRHACPGRYFAVTELKAMLAHLVTTYDIKLENEGVRPPNLLFEVNILPNRSAEVMFRKRRV